MKIVLRDATKSNPEVLCIIYEKPYGELETPRKFDDCILTTTFGSRLRRIVRLRTD